MKNATSFGLQASTYAKGRPGYPAELYSWISENSSGQTLVWDVGTGSGQAAQALTDYFEHIHTTDVSAEQISAASLHPKINYLTAPAHSSGLEDNTADAITAATALHWFADAMFWDEVHRVAANDALFSAWTYQLPISTPEVHALFLDPIYERINPYWAAGNRLCMAGYTAEALNCPFPTLSTPDFDAGGIWKAEQLVSFAESWSAHFRARKDGLQPELDDLACNFLTKFGARDIKFSLPLSVLAARIAE